MGVFFVEKEGYPLGRGIGESTKGESFPAVEASIAREDRRYF